MGRVSSPKVGAKAEPEAQALMTTTSFSIQPSLNQVLTDHARAERRSVSFILREAIRKHLIEAGVEIPADAVE